MASHVAQIPRDRCALEHVAAVSDGGAPHAASQHVEHFECHGQRSVRTIVCQIEARLCRGGVGIGVDVKYRRRYSLAYTEGDVVGGGVARGVPYAERERVVAIGKSAQRIGYRAARSAVGARGVVERQVAVGGASVKTERHLVAYAGHGEIDAYIVAHIGQEHGRFIDRLPRKEAAVVEHRHVDGRRNGVRRCRFIGAIYVEVRVDAGSLHVARRAVGIHL